MSSEILYDIERLPNNLRPALSKTVRINSDKILTNDRGFEIQIHVIENLYPITPFEKADNLILFLGNKQDYTGNYINLSENQHRNKSFALIGMSVKDSESDFNYICKSLIEGGLISSPDLDKQGNLNGSTFRRLQLTFKGWKKYGELQHSIKDSKTVFMAMKFPHADIKPPYPPYNELDTVYKAFQEKIKETGFTLTNPLLDRPEGGSIDNRLAVEIRKAKFIVADLSHDNQGVYWEAGFANGLGKKVFYTCKKDDRIETHFDISHHTTIFWEVGKEEEAAEKLRDTIRNTFPEDAIQ